MFANVERSARNSTADTSEQPTGVTMATTGPDTPIVKKEKPNSPPPQTEVTTIHCPRLLPFPRIARLGYLSQNEVYVTTGARRRLNARPQCSICLKTFSRSGTLKVLVANVKLPDCHVRNGCTK